MSKPKLNAKHDFGECHVCGDELQPQRITQDFWIKGQLVVLEGVPAGVCPQCGEKVVTAKVGREVAALLADPERRSSARVISVPVIKFPKAAA